MKFTPFALGAERVETRRNLPHWEQPGRTYFVTFRLADSIPKSQLDQWIRERDRWLCSHPKPWNDEEWKEYQATFLKRIERWADIGYGECVLKHAGFRQIVIDAFLFFDAESGADAPRYAMGDFVVMPNHVHLLVTPLDGWELGKLVHSWKSFTANAINRALGRIGSLWMDERFDHIVRSRESLEHFRRYIGKNPEKAGLAEGDYHLHQVHWE